MSSSAFTRLHGIFSKHLSAITKGTIPTLQISSSPPEIQELVTKFKENSMNPRFRHHRHFYERTVQRLAAEKHFSAIESILECQKEYKYNMSDEGFGVRLIKLYVKAGMFDHAYKVFDELPQFNSPRTVYSFNALLSACVKSKKLDKVSEFFRELPEKLGIEPDVVMYNLVMKGFCRANDLDSAMKLIEKMEESVIRPDIVSYSTILEAYCKVNELSAAEKLWKRMKEKGVIYDVWTYNSKIRSLIKNDRVQEALELVEEMVKEGVNPVSHTYNALIKGCVDNGNLKESKMFHGKMMADG